MGTIAKMRNAACFIFVFAVLAMMPAAAYAALAEGEPPPVGVKPEVQKIETECPPGSFKFDGTCWVQGDCPEGEAIIRQGVCAPIPNWRYAPPVEEVETPALPTEEDKPKK